MLMQRKARAAGGRQISMGIVRAGAARAALNCYYYHAVLACFNNRTLILRAALGNLESIAGCVCALDNFFLGYNSELNIWSLSRIKVCSSNAFHSRVMSALNMPNRYGVRRAHMVGATRPPPRPAFVQTLVSNLCVSRRFGYLPPHFFHLASFLTQAFCSLVLLQYARKY